MTKNLMPEVAKLLGVEIEERFKIHDINRNTIYREEFCFNKKEGLVKLIVDGPNGKTVPRSCEWDLMKLIMGWAEIVKQPWQPKEGELYFHSSLKIKQPYNEEWTNDTFDYAMQALGMIYRTREEAKQHFADDYQKLTGKKLNEKA